MPYFPWCNDTTWPQTLHDLYADINTHAVHLVDGLKVSLEYLEGCRLRLAILQQQIVYIRGVMTSHRNQSTFRMAGSPSDHELPRYSILGMNAETRF